MGLVFGPSPQQRGRERLHHFSESLTILLLLLCGSCSLLATSGAVATKMVRLDCTLLYIYMVCDLDIFIISLEIFVVIFFNCYFFLAWSKVISIIAKCLWDAKTSVRIMTKSWHQRGTPFSLHRCSWPLPLVLFDQLFALIFVTVRRTNDLDN